jgi:hypothetical protein
MKKPTSTYLVGSVDLPWQQSGMDIEPLASVTTNPTPKQSSKSTGQKSSVTKTSAKYEASYTQESLFSQAGFHANHSQSQGSNEARMTTVIAKYMADTISLSERSAHGSKVWGCVRGRQDEDISQRNEMGSNSSDSRENVADTVKQGREGRVYRRENTERESVDGYSGCGGTTHGQSGEAIWLAEPNVGRVANGIPNRTHRLKGLGNAIVPQVASEIIRCINKIMEDNK